MKILIVDDEKEFADRISDFLRLSGHEIYTTYSGEQGLELLEKEKPDVLLCDLKMRGAVHGEDVLSRLGSISPDTIPIVITAYKDEAVHSKLAEKGVTKVLYKPIQLNELESTLQDLK